MNTCFALYSLGGGEIILIVTLILLLIGAKHLPKIGKGLGEGMDEFREATRKVGGELSPDWNERDWELWDKGVGIVLVVLLILTIIGILALEFELL